MTVILLTHHAHKASSSKALGAPRRLKELCRVEMNQLPWRPGRFRDSLITFEKPSAKILYDTECENLSGTLISIGKYY